MFCNYVTYQTFLSAHLDLIFNKIESIVAFKLISIPRILHNGAIIFTILSNLSFRLFNLQNYPFMPIVFHSFSHLICSPLYCSRHYWFSVPSLCELWRNYPWYKQTPRHISFPHKNNICSDPKSPIPANYCKLYA